MDYTETIVSVTCFLIIIFTGVLVVCVVWPVCPLANIDCSCLNRRRDQRRSQPEEIYVTDSITYYQPSDAGTIGRPSVLPGQRGGAMYQPCGPGTTRRQLVLPGQHGGAMYQPCGIETNRRLPISDHAGQRGGAMNQPCGPGSTRRPSVLPGQRGGTMYQPVGTSTSRHVHPIPHLPIADHAGAIHQSTEPPHRPIDAPPAYDSLNK